MKIRISRADGIAPAVSTDYTTNINKYDSQIIALQDLLKKATNELASAQRELGDAISARNDCSFTSAEWATSALVPGSGIYFSADQNKCLDDNNGRQDKARAAISAAQAKIKSLNTQIATIQAQKDAANIDLRTQQATETANETERIKAAAGKAVAEGSVSPDVIKAKGAAEAEANDANNKKILYAGVVIFIVLAAIGGLYIVATRKSA